MMYFTCVSVISSMWFEIHECDSSIVHLPDVCYSIFKKYLLANDLNIRIHTHKWDGRSLTLRGRISKLMGMKRII
jgi:hypothetical protein